MNKDTKFESHPSYGQAVFSRVYGNIGRLYGSPLERHHSAIVLKISRSEVGHDLGQDWRHPTQELIEVVFSPAEFADLLTTMNVGEGVPCTIERVAGERMPPVPQGDKVEHEKVVDYFKKGQKETVATLKKGLTELRALLYEKKSLSKADKETIEWLVEKALQDVEQNQPFVLKQFGEAAEKVVTAARAEVAATTQALVEKLGFQKIGEMQAALGTAPMVDVPAISPKEGE